MQALTLRPPATLRFITHRSSGIAVRNRDEKPKRNEENTMSKVGGHRNFGYGKQMVWAGKQALQARYGQGHHGTVASHAKRWQQFVLWCQTEKDIRDARDIDRADVIGYGQSLAERIARNDLSVSYGQNLVSSVNMPGYTLGVSVRGNTAYVGCSSYGLRIVDITDLANPEITAGVAGRGGTEDMALAGDCVLFAGNGAGLQIIDLTSQEGPPIVAIHSMSGDLRSVATVGETAATGTGVGLVPQLAMHPAMIIICKSTGSTRLRPAHIPLNIRNKPSILLPLLTSRYRRY